MTRSGIIEKTKICFGTHPKAKNKTLSDSLLVETIFNEGTLDDCRELITTLGGKYIAKVFFSAKDRQKANYYPEIISITKIRIAKY